MSCHRAMAMMVRKIARYWLCSRIPPNGTNTLRRKNPVRLMCQEFQNDCGLVLA